MKLFSFLLGMAAIIALSLYSQSAEAAGPLRQGIFARALNVGPLRHASAYRGAEVVYRKNSGRATQAEAMAAWAASPAHAQAINSGKISSVVCRGRVCVGR